MQANSEEDELPGYQEIPLVEALNGKIKPDNIPEGVQRLKRSLSPRCFFLHCIILSAAVLKLGGILF